MRFLIVDDNATSRELAIQTLRSSFEDAVFIEVGCRHEFDEALALEDFDVVLTDYQLSWSDGLEVFREVRARYPEVPVLMFTDSGNEEVAVTGMKMGLNDYLLKRDLKRLPLAVSESIEKVRLQRNYEETERQLRLSEERYRAISELVSDYAFSYRVARDGSSIREWITDAFYHITGYSQAEVDAAGGWMFVLHPDDVEVAEAHRRRLLQGRVSTVSYRIRTREGDERWLRVTGRPVWDPGQGRVVRVYGAAQDITDRRVAVEALRASEARFRALFDYAALGIILLGPDHRVLAANPAFAEMLGYDAEELVDVPCAELTHPDDVEEDVRLYEQLLEGDIAVYQTEKRYLHRDGHTIYARLTVSRVDDRATAPEFVIAMAEDVSDERAAQEALIRAEKMTLTGTLAASIAHEINNPLQAVVGCLGLALESLEIDDDVNRAHQLMEIAQDEIRRAANIVAELRDLNRRSAPEERELVSVAELLDRVLTLSTGELGDSQVEIRQEVPTDLPPVMVVPDRLHQVFLNLILNANHAMPEGGVLTIKAAQTSSPEGVRVTISDTGVGISDENQARLFEPFFTTRSDGIGLGLYVTRNIVEEHKGKIEIESEPGKGTAVHVWLPFHP